MGKHGYQGERGYTSRKACTSNKDGKLIFGNFRKYPISCFIFFLSGFSNVYAPLSTWANYGS